MNEVEQYEKIINSVFDDFICNKFESNNFSTAIISNSNFDKLRASFIDRLLRIKPLVESGDEHSKIKWKKTIYDIINSIADERNCEGAWAELCALDVFYKVASNCFYELDSEVDKNANDTLGKFFNKTVTNYDLSLGDNLLLDVKILADKELKIIQDLCDKETNDSDVTILPEIPYQLEYGTITSNIKNIILEIKESINSSQSNYKSTVIEGLSYKIQRGKGVLMAIGSHEPYLYAKNEHKLVFQHFNKLHITIPTMLVYVIHPWYSNSSLSSSFTDSRNIVFRSIARRLFIQYKDKEINERLPNNATENLAGLMFIVDNSVENQDNQIFFYTNPNAKNKMYSICQDMIKDTLHCTHDWFIDDNY